MGSNFSGSKSAGLKAPLDMAENDLCSADDKWRTTKKFVLSPGVVKIKGLPFSSYSISPAIKGKWRTAFFNPPQKEAISLSRLVEGGSS